MNSDLGKLRAHANNIAIHHMIFALPFAYTSAFLAAGGLPPLWDLLWITVAIAGARSAAMALDNLVDLKYDRQQPRLAYRAMVRGEITPHEARITIVICLSIFLLAVLQLKPICIELLPVAAVPFLIYPYMKRVTFLCHGMLGLAIAMAPAGGWVAVSGSITLPMVIFCAAVGAWIGAFDAVYACQDEAFDRSQGLHSLATRFTAHGALLITRCLHAFSILCFLWVGMLLELHFWYYIGVGVAALTLVYQHSIVHAGDYHRVTQVYFMRNGIVSLAMFLFTWLSFYF